jgi:hypothetical protein
MKGIEEFKISNPTVNIKHNVKLETTQEILLLNQKVSYAHTRYQGKQVYCSVLNEVLVSKI